MEFNKEKMYLSPSKEMVSLYIDGEWKIFIRSDITFNPQPSQKLNKEENVREDVCLNCNGTGNGNYNNPNIYGITKCGHCGGTGQKVW